MLGEYIKRRPLESPKNTGGKGGKSDDEQNKPPKEKKKRPPTPASVQRRWHRLAEIPISTEAERNKAFNRVIGTLPKLVRDTQALGLWNDGMEVQVRRVYHMFGIDLPQTEEGQVFHIGPPDDLPPSPLGGVREPVGPQGPNNNPFPDRSAAAVPPSHRDNGGN